MSQGLYSHTTRSVGTVLTAAIYNSDHVKHITNHNPSQMGGYSDTVGEMQNMATPGGVGSESLAGSLADELERLRFVIDRIVGGAQWYEAPAFDLSSADIAAIAALDKTDGNFIVANGTTWIAEAGATARASLGVSALGTLTGAQGELPYFGASGVPAALGVGTSGQVATTQGAAADPAWAWEHVVQTVKATDITAITTVTGTIPQDDTIPGSGEGVSVISKEITTKSDSHTVLVWGVINLGAASDARHTLAIFRGTTCIQVMQTEVMDSSSMFSIPYSFLDEPATEGAITYSVRVGTASGNVTKLNSNGTSRLFGGAAKCTMYLQELR